eukprot:4032966-Prymnesium_polylepis.1
MPWADQADAVRRAAPRLSPTSRVPPVHSCCAPSLSHITRATTLAAYRLSPIIQITCATTLAERRAANARR